MRQKQPTRKQELVDACASVGLYVRTYSPGDGVTRCRFFVTGENGSGKRAPSGSADEPNSYFGPGNGIYTALGITAAEDFIRGYTAAKWSAAS